MAPFTSHKQLKSSKDIPFGLALTSMHSRMLYQLASNS